MSSTKSRFTTTALAVALAGIGLAGTAVAADMPVKTPPAPAPAPFFLVNDNSVSFTWYPNATDPGVSGGQAQGLGNNGTTNTFNKYVGSATHFDVWAYGTDFFNIDFLQSDSHDPVQGIPGARGAAEVYGFARSTISGNALAGSKIFSNLVTKDISFEWGGDANTENNQLGPNKRDIVLGVQFALNLPGTVNFAALGYKEWNHNWFLSCGPGNTSGACISPPGGEFTGDRSFHIIPRLELLISEPLSFLPWAVTWNGFTGVNFPKGTGISQANLAAVPPGPTAWNIDSAETKVEVFEDNRLTFDLSKMWWGKAQVWEAYVGYRYWYNKFGTDHSSGVFNTSGCSAPPGTGFGCSPGTAIESTAYIGTTYHFK